MEARATPPSRPGPPKDTKLRPKVEVCAVTSYPIGSQSEHSGLMLLLRIDSPEQAEALHGFRASFAAQADLEPVDEDHFVLHVYPGVCACGGGGDAA
jgi:hypothetical protein